MRIYIIRNTLGTTLPHHLIPFQDGGTRVLHRTLWSNVSEDNFFCVLVEDGSCVSQLTGYIYSKIGLPLPLNRFLFAPNRYHVGVLIFSMIIKGQKLSNFSYWFNCKNLAQRATQHRSNKNADIANLRSTEIIIHQA